MPILCSTKCFIHRACPARCGAAASHLSSFLLGHRVRQQHGLGSAHSVSAERWNNVFVLLLFTAAARIHNRLSSAFLQHFSNQSNILQHFVYTAHIFLVYCYRNFPGSERPMQQNGSWKWWQIWLGKTGIQIWELVVIKYTLPSARAATCKSLTTWRRNSYQQWGKSIAVWLELDLMITNLKFTDQIRLLSWKHYFYLKIWMWKEKKHQKQGQMARLLWEQLLWEHTRFQMQWTHTYCQDLLESSCLQSCEDDGDVGSLCEETLWMWMKLFWGT